ncbi:hypothetical protein TRAPUB_9451 [Trametes pubescens]|uniref:F-box domain-containing protein n=1 Tax=Trametes pubescens TaxID=154538 RepID=A0A1M2W277_TRAPU|nr:hypothetical protein TRAPUB_9451 [Trametes pubescens]
MASLTPFRPSWPRDPEGQYQSPRILHEQIMQVCRHWWGVAQSTASLWSDIILRPRRELASAQIQQARTTSVNVYCEGDVESLVPVLSEHAHRIRFLHIRTMDCSDSSTMQRMDAVFMILPRMALHIEEFVLHAWYVHWPMISKERPIVSLFSGHAPRLRVLSIFCVRRMLTGSFPNLRKLYLIICGSPIATEVLDFLRESPILEHIHLEAPG